MNTVKKKELPCLCSSNLNPYLASCHDHFARLALNFSVTEQMCSIFLYFVTFILLVQFFLFAVKQTGMIKSEI